jgi:MFS family permease
VTAARAPEGRFAALRSRDFRLLLAGQLVSLAGSQMRQVAVVWQLYSLDRSPGRASLVLGSLGLFRVLPIFLFAVGGGVIADAFDRRRLLMASESLLGLTSLGLALATHLGFVSLPWIYGLTFVAGVGMAFDRPARQALLPELVPEQDLPNALSLHAFVLKVATVAGPALGGVLVAWVGPGPVYLIDALSFLAVIAALGAMDHRPASAERADVALGSVLEVLRFLRRSPILLSTMLLDFVATFLGGSTLLMPLFADGRLHVGARGLGLLYAAEPAGAVVAGFFLASLRPIRRQGLAVLVAVAVYGLAIAGFGVSRWFWLSLLLLAISGAADTVSTVIRQTLRQLLTPAALRGRMTGVNMIFFVGGPQLGEVEAGVVASLVSPSFSVVSGGVACVLAALAVASLVPSLRRHPEA